MKLSSGEKGACTSCQNQGRPVFRKTVLLMLKPDLLEHAIPGNYRFCFAPDCPVVYFDEESKRQFTIDDLRIRVGVKVKVDPIPLCYCFGFDESRSRRDRSNRRHDNSGDYCPAHPRGFMCVRHSQPFGYVLSG
jgi:hypothetical protein